MLATLESSSGFLSGSCGDFAATEAANRKHIDDSQAKETNPLDIQERLLIDTLNSALEMIASNRMIQRRASLWQARNPVNGPRLNRREYDVFFRGVGV
jgi:hypothetical protein